MPQPVEERRPPITPQLAVRVAVLGGVAFVLFAIVFFRLWFLQVLSGEDFVSQARENRVRKVRIEAPRGDIVDRHGTVLVKTRVAPVVQIVPSSLPESVLAQADEFRKAARRGGDGAPGRRRPAARARARHPRAPPRRQPQPAPRAPPAGALRPPRDAGAGPAAARRRDRAAAPVPRARARDQRAPEADPRARDRGRRRAALLERDDQVGGQPRGVQLHPRAQGASSPASRSRSSTCATTRTTSSAPSCSGPRARSRRPSSSSSATRASSRARGSAPTASRRATTSTCAAPTASRRS